MGLLDDAIKEHLELKRKHGAAEEELRRQEGEALGPARRDFAGDPAAPVEPEAPVAEPVAPVPADDAQGAYEPAEPAGWLDDEPGGAPFGAEHPAPEEPVEHAAEAADATLAHEPVPAPPREEPPPVRSQTPTEGFPAVSRDEDPPPAGDEDVLEETPDFLQDTPEHDRLWFEQKPPRDFDFDG
jgi:hypothetical protein